MTADPIAGAVAAVYRSAATLDPDGRWITLPGIEPVLAQGWKLHVSATIPDAISVVGRVLPILRESGASAKVAASLTVLAELNEGAAGPSQIGKFVTVYPGDDAQAVALATRLAEATRGLRGPAVPSDRPLWPGCLVHYRYGGFRDRPVRTPLGEILPGIVTPEGELVADRRDPVYRPPVWAVDPFAAAGVAADIPRRSLAVVGRYVMVSLLNRSARGPVYLAVERPTFRRCVLKRAPADAVARADGMDAHAYLRHEYAILRRLAGHPAFPEPRDLVEEGPDLYLVMEDVEGLTLGEAATRHPSGERATPVARWGRELAGALGHLHRHRLVHGDVKPDNVIVAPDGRVRLLDFDGVFDPDGPTPPTGAGTRGYQSPQRELRAIPTPLDDVWALGATLLAAMTGLTLGLVPDPRRLHLLPIEALAPGASPALVAAIRRCLAPDPAARFPSMDAVAEALAGAGPPSDSGPGGASALLGPSRPSHHVDHTRQAGDAATPDSRAAWRDLARRTGDGLLALARRPGDRSIPGAWLPPGTLAWRSPSFSSLQGLSGDLNLGVAGPTLALAELVDALDHHAHREALAGAATWLLDPPQPGGIVAPGLWVGEAGRGAALLRAGQVLGDSRLVEAAAATSLRVAALPHASPDFYNGTAGRLRFHLLLWDETGEDEHRAAALAAGMVLERAALLDDGGGIRWGFPAGYEELSGDSRCLGYSHGAAGIADALLDLFDVTADDRWLTLARGAVRWLLLQATAWPPHGTRPDGRPALAWPRLEGGSPAPPLWCHGATGIGRFLLHAATADIPDALDAALGAAVAAASVQGAPAGQCHGQAGAIEFLLDVFQATGDSAHLDSARGLGHTMSVFSCEREGQLLWASELPGEVSHEYVAGASGIVPCLLRLADPGRPSHLDRRGFRWRSTRPGPSGPAVDGTNRAARSWRWLAGSS